MKNGFAEGQPTATIFLDRERTIGHSFGATNRALAILGTADFKSESQADIAKKLPVWIWACLPEADRAELTPERVADLIHRKNLAAVLAAFVSVAVDSAEGDGQANPTLAGAETLPAGSPG